MKRFVCCGDLTSVPCRNRFEEATRFNKGSISVPEGAFRHFRSHHVPCVLRVTGAKLPFTLLRKTHATDYFNRRNGCLVNIG